MPQQLNRVAPLLEQMSQQPLAISQTAAALFQQSIEYVVSDAKAMATAFATTKEAKAAATMDDLDTLFLAASSSRRLACSG